MTLWHRAIRLFVNDYMATPLWTVGVVDLISKISDDLEVMAISGASELDKVRQTGFVWTHQAGVICLAMNRLYLETALENPDVMAIIAPPSVVGAEIDSDKAVIVSQRADELFHYLHMSQARPDVTDAFQISPSAHVDETAILKGPICIGDDVAIAPRVVIQGPATIRRGTVIEAGAIIGCDGLYAKTVKGRKHHLPHFGGVEIGEDAYVHSGAVIVRSAIKGEATRIGDRAHIGVMTNIGHDVEIGTEATISSNCVIAGRARVGKHAWVGASANISNMVNIGDYSKVRIGSVVVRDVPSGADFSGNFAVPHIKNVKKLMRELRNEG